MGTWYLYEASVEGEPLPVSQLPSWGPAPYRRYDSPVGYASQWEAEERGRRLLSMLPPSSSTDRADRLPGRRLRVGTRPRARVPLRRPATVRRAGGRAERLDAAHNNWPVAIDEMTDIADAALATARMVRQPAPDRCWIHYCRPVWVPPDSWAGALRTLRTRGLLDLGRCDAPGAHPAALVAAAAHDLDDDSPPVHYILLGGT